VLTDYAASLRERGSIEVPEFDPSDGGVEARALLLLEKPGRMTAEVGSGKRSSSRFISRDNDDPTRGSHLQVHVRGSYTSKADSHLERDSMVELQEKSERVGITGRRSMRGGLDSLAD
jgi:hypothetical protein